MEIRKLNYFYVTAKEGHITHAANILHISQPTLSKQIKELEEELKCALFIRRSHSVSLTLEGERLFKRAEEILSLVDKTINEFIKSADDIQGDIFIGGGETWIFKQIGKIFSEIHQKYPNIRLRIYSGDYQSITSRLDKGLLDFGLVIHPANLAKYNHFPLRDTNIWGLIMRKDSPLAAQTVIEKNDLSNIPLIISDQVLLKDNDSNPLINWFDGNINHLNIVSTYTLSYNAATLASAGVGNVLTLNKLVDISEKSPLCFRPLSPRLEAGIDIIWKKEQIFSPASNLFLQHLLQEFGEGGYE